MFGALSGNPWDILALAVFLVLCAGGGWALVRSGFDLTPGDRPLTGAALGLVLATWGANVLGRWIDPPLAFWLAAVALAVAGGVALWTRRHAVGGRADSRSLALLVVVLVLAYLFFRMGRGLAIFDERKNLSLISLMAAGEIPPRFYMNPDYHFAYHYAFQLFGAMAMRIGGLLPWTAFDLAKGIAGALAVGLAVIWGRRATGRWTGGTWLGVVLLFASGARWLLLLLPASWLATAGQDVVLWGTTAQMQGSLSTMLVSGWGVEGGPPIPLPFAFVNGILQPLVLYLQTGPVSMGLIAVLLVLILYPVRARPWAWGILVALLAFWALAAEASFVLFGFGSVGACVVLFLRRRRGAALRPALVLLGAVALAGLIAAFQGGTITEAVRGAPSEMAAQGAAPSVAGFSVRDAPAIVSSHLGELRLGNPGEVLIALAELGLPLLLMPLAAWVLVRSARRGRALTLAVALSAFLGFLLPILLRYEVDRDITRLTYYALVVWLLLSVNPLHVAWSRGGGFIRVGIALATAALILPGLAVTGSLLTAVPRAVLVEDLRPADTSMARQVWDRLEPGALIMDSHPWRAVVVTGRLTRSARDSSTPLEAWQALVDHPRLERLVAAGFDYVYVDRTWWDDMDERARDSFRAACVQEVATVHDNGRNGDRWLYDLRGCRPE
jgi:hypothetical protein